MATNTHTQMSRKRILIVDDEQELREVLGEVLSEEFKIVYARGGDEALSIFDQQPPDAVVLDIRMPQTDGFEVCSRIRKAANGAQTPIIVLSGSDDAATRVRALELGANDFMGKPFNPTELLLRVKLRVGDPSKPSAQPALVTYQGLSYEPQSRLLRSGTHQLILREIEGRIVHRLVEQQGAIVSRNDLASFVWTNEADMDARKLDPHISALRKKLQGLQYNIKMVYGLGYAIEPLS